MSLKIEEVKAGDKLECIDHDGYLDSVNENALDLTSIVIREVDHNLSLFLTEGKGQGKSIKFSAIKYFKKKEQSQQYTFDDLIDVAKKGVRDGVLCIFKFGADLQDKDLLNLITTENKKALFTYQDAEEGIKYIQALYKETFVIESEEDLKRVKVDAKITLANGNESYVCCLNDPLDSLLILHSDTSLDIFALKGATVEQERGRNDQ